MPRPKTKEGVEQWKANMSKARIGFKISEETKKKISESHKGKKLTPEHIEKLRKAKLGKKVSEVTREKHRQWKHSDETKEKMANSHLGEKAYNWKGSDVGYTGLHKWVIRNLGTPNTCEHCKKTGLSSYRIQWANKSGKYLRSLDDWLRLCVPCHRKYDKNLIN